MGPRKIIENFQNIKTKSVNSTIKSIFIITYILLHLLLKKKVDLLDWTVVVTNLSGRKGTATI